MIPESRLTAWLLSMKIEIDQSTSELWALCTYDGIHPRNYNLVEMAELVMLN